MICAELYNIHRDREQHPEPFSAADFLPFLRGQEEEDEAERDPTPEELEAYKQRLFGAFGRPAAAPPPSPQG
jgi:hypothetical protein